MNNVNFVHVQKEELRAMIAEETRKAFESIKQIEPPKGNTEYITRQQTADLLGISLPTLNEYTKKGIVVGYRLGTRVRYIKAEVEASLKQIQSSKYKPY